MNKKTVTAIIVGAGHMSVYKADISRENGGVPQCVEV